MGGIYPATTISKLNDVYYVIEHKDFATRSYLTKAGAARAFMKYKVK